MGDTHDKVLVFGCFCYWDNQLDGQTVKTREIFSLIKERHPGVVNYADTREFRHSLRKIFCFFRDLVRCDKLVYIPAHNNLRFLFVPLFICSKLLGFEILYVVVGGWLVEFIDDKYLVRKCLGKIRHIFTQNDLMKVQLRERYGYDNVTRIPNFRRGSFSPSFATVENRLRLVFMARVNRMKGLDVVFQLAEYIDGKYPDGEITIDMYGPVNEDDRFYFEENLTLNNSVTYCGVLQPEMIPQTLDNYDVMLFPTHFYTEGFPGTVLDAYRAGIPVIASRWKHAHEYVDEGVTGFIIPFEKNVTELCGKVDFLFANPEKLCQMKQAAYRKSRDYTPDAAWGVIGDFLK